MTTPAGALLTRTPVQIHDPDGMCEFLGREIAPGRVRLGRLAAGGVLKALALDAWNITHSRLALPDSLFRADNPVTGIWAFHLISGRWECQSAATMSRYSPGDACLLLPTDGPGTVRSYSAYMGATHLYPHLLAQVAATSPTESPGPVRFTSNHPVTPAASRRWDRIAKSVFELFNDEEVARQPLIVGNAARLLAGVALSVFPNTAVADPTPTDRWDANAATLKRAAAYMEEHISDDVSLADIAAAAHVTIRAVEFAFRRRLGTTPSIYLRRIRLERAHRDLLTADPCHCTVATVAARWGFAPSRFASYYHQAYGMHPRETLRSA